MPFADIFRRALSTNRGRSPQGKRKMGFLIGFIVAIVILVMALATCRQNPLIFMGRLAQILSIGAAGLGTAILLAPTMFAAPPAFGWLLLIIFGSASALVSVAIKLLSRRMDELTS